MGQKCDSPQKTNTAKQKTAFSAVFFISTLSNPEPALTSTDQHMVVINTQYTLHHDMYGAITVMGDFPLGCPSPCDDIFLGFVFASLPVTKQL